jgi:hypothetical protein
MSDIDWSAVAAEFFPLARKFLDQIPIFEKIWLSPSESPEDVVGKLAEVAGVPVKSLTEAGFYKGIADHAWADFLAKLPDRELAELPEQPRASCSTTAKNSIRRLMAFVQKKADEKQATVTPDEPVAEKTVPPKEAPPTEHPYKMVHVDNRWYITFEGEERPVIPDRESEALEGVARLFSSPHDGIEGSVLIGGISLSGVPRTDNPRVNEEGAENDPQRISLRKAWIW